MVGHCDGNRIHFLALEQLSDIRVGRNAAAQVLGFPVQDVPVHVAKGHQAHPFELAQAADMAAALAMKANLPDANITVRPGHPAPGTSIDAECGGAKGGRLEKIPACEVFHSVRFAFNVF